MCFEQHQGNQRRSGDEGPNARGRTLGLSSSRLRVFVAILMLRITLMRLKAVRAPAIDAAD
jgi:hypothetical protein